MNRRQFVGAAAAVALLPTAALLAPPINWLQVEYFAAGERIGVQYVVAPFVLSMIPPELAGLFDIAIAQPVRHHG